MRIVIYDYLNTIRFKLLIGITVFLVPFFFVLIYNNYYTTNTILEQVAATNKNANSLYLSQIDNNLKDAEKYLADLVSNDINFWTIKSDANSGKRILAGIGLSNRLATEILLYDGINVFYIYSPEDDQYIFSKKGDLSIKEIGIVNDYIKYDIIHGNSRSESKGYNWKIYKINGYYYLNCRFKSGNLYAGAWLKADQLLTPIIDSDLRGQILLFVTGQNEPMNHAQFISDNKIKFENDFTGYYLSGKNDEFLITGNRSTRCDMTLLTIDTIENILWGFPYLQRIALIILIGTVITIPFYYLLLRVAVLRPLKEILTTINRIKKGNIKNRIRIKKTSTEFETLHQAFNDMMNQIENLRIRVYEERLCSQQEELEKLQLQVRPHFFLNSLGIIHNLAKARDYELLQIMTKCLIEYFRFIFRSNVKFVLFKDELLNVKNYLQIQQVRYPDNLKIEIKVDDHLLEYAVPPLLVHTFVENTIKYAMDLDRIVTISIEARMIEMDSVHAVFISIGDSGSGYSDEILQKLNAGERIIDEDREHTGIFNLRRRLSILYNGRARLVFKNNNEGGATVEINLPVEN